MVNSKSNKMMKEYFLARQTRCACHTKSKSDLAKARSAVAGYLLHPFLPSPMLASVDIAMCKENPHILRYSFSCSFMFYASLAWSCSMRVFHNKSIFSFILCKVGDAWCFSQNWAVFTTHKNVAKHSIGVLLQHLGASCSSKIPENWKDFWMQL